MLFIIAADINIDEIKKENNTDYPDFDVDDYIIADKNVIS